jgi:thioredoxin-dependent peroxiredoxin
MPIIKCDDSFIETIGSPPLINSTSPNISVCNGDFRLFNLKDDFEDQAIVLFIIPSLDTSTCMACLKHFSRLAIEKKLTYLIITSDTPFALKRITNTLPFNSEYVCSDMVLKELGTMYNLLIRSGPLASFVARSVFVLDKKHTIKYFEICQDISNPIDYKKLDHEISLYFPSADSPS